MFIHSATVGFVASQIVYYNDCLGDMRFPFTMYRQFSACDDTMHSVMWAKVPVTTGHLI